MDSSDDRDDKPSKSGLTSEERVLLREKKKARLQKEQGDNTDDSDKNPEDPQPRLTRSGRRRGLGRLDAVVDKLQDKGDEDSAE